MKNICKITECTRNKVFQISRNWNVKTRKVAKSVTRAKPCNELIQYDTISRELS